MLGQVGSVVNAVRGYPGIGAPVMRAIAYWKLGLDKRLSSTLSALRARLADSPSISSIDELFQIVSVPYAEHSEPARLVRFEERLLIQAA
jgi:hypothetical protein